MIKPKYLESGDKIAIVAPAKHISKKQTEFFIKKLASLGFKVQEGKNLYKMYGAFAGTDTERASDLQWALDDPEIACIIMARGGYGTTRIIDKLDFSAFVKNPKWVVGFSDISALHGHIQELGFETIHSAMPLNLNGSPERKPAMDSLLKLLFGDDNELKFAPHITNRIGTSEGILTGGNLSVLVHSIGTPSFPKMENKILVLEDIGESMYHIDRMMVHLSRMGVFEKLKGVVFGHFTDIKDHGEWFEGSLEKVLFSHVKKYDYPVCFHAPIGHEPLNLAVKFGAISTLDVQKNSVRIIQKA